ncbi:MAG: TIGR01212 family radical SAM protein [[Clostridium] spiroforme]|uniref:TIGR01212 family radical SAM protein n=2 Tax=Thomasclavelia spiroformis TaxID=29348 RepID=A0A943I4S0_9FIRM|nr:TIGR01212 family radical SAM protein [Thomasclavelia spiroformis]MBS5589042.1 TIGR01212 family radical SAM protein [Thomasclavelia spiroformis]
MNTFKFSNDNKRYHTFNYYLKNKYHNKVAKVSLNANFTCPNRDGTKGIGGCIFCSNSGSGDFAGNVKDSLEKQFDDVSTLLQKKWPNCKYIAYFQANSNTYGPVEKLRNCIEPFINKKDVVAISIATRPDCLEDEILEYLDSVNKRCDLWIELGLQTIHDKTAKLINRGHSYLEFIEGLNKLRHLNINVCVHIINGLPFETYEMMLTTAKEIGKLDIQALKIHMLYVIKNTKLHQMYQNNEFTMLNRDEYIDLVTEQLSYLPENIVIERLTGDGNVNDLIAPDWSIKKVTILNDIDKLMVKKNYVQGCNFVEK